MIDIYTFFVLGSNSSSLYVIINKDFTHAATDIEVMFKSDNELTRIIEENRLTQWLCNLTHQTLLKGGINPPPPGMDVRYRYLFGFQSSSILGMYMTLLAKCNLEEENLSPLPKHYISPRGEKFESVVLSNCYPDLSYHYTYLEPNFPLRVLEL